VARPEADLPDVPGDPPLALDRLLTPPPTIVHAVEAFGGGVLSVVAALANAAVERGHTCSIVYGRRPETPERLEDVVDARVRLIEVPGWGRRRRSGYLAETVRAARALRRELARHDGGVVHLHSSLAGAAGRLLPARGWVMFYSPHAYAYLNQSLPQAVRRFARGVERVLGPRGTTVAVSRAEAAAAARLVGERKVVLIHNGVELPLEVPPPGRGPFTVVCIGRASFQRRADLVAHVALRVRRELCARFVWVGDGSYGQELRAAGVAVEGWVPPEQARERLVEAHAVLHLSAFEGLPVAVLEAMAAGRAIVATDLPPLREALGDAGLLVRDEREAADALLRLASDAALRDELGERARDRVARRFSTQLMIERTLAAYAARPPRTPRSNGFARAISAGSEVS
jgi:glycosyltransferase involved in cell wall biosynthesis